VYRFSLDARREPRHALTINKHLIEARVLEAVFDDAARREGARAVIGVCEPDVTKLCLASSRVLPILGVSRQGVPQDLRLWPAGRRDRAELEAAIRAEGEADVLVAGWLRVKTK